MEDSSTISVTVTKQKSRMRDVAMLCKMRLTLLVVISAILGFFMGTSEADWTKLFALSIGGILLTGGSNGMNQVLEKEWDRLMLRTQNRPIPAGRMQPQEGLIISLFAGIGGILILWIFINTACGVLGLLAFFMYVFIYTPMKRVSSLAVFIGAFPGAIPPMLGYVAATNTYGLEAGLLFAMQFMWQFPHFWAIAWVAHDDYVRGGYKLLPFNDGRSKKSAFQILLYSLFLIPVSLLPWAMPLNQPLIGNVAAIVATLSGSLMAYFAFKLYRSCDIADARKVMFTSFFYLPVVQLFYVIDKLV